MANVKVDGIKNTLRSNNNVSFFCSVDVSYALAVYCLLVVPKFNYFIQSHNYSISSQVLRPGVIPKDNRVESAVTF